MTDMLPLDIENRIARIEAENRELRQELASLKERGGRRVVPAAPEPQTRVSSPVVIVPLDLPNEQELKALRDLCLRAYPKWCEGESYAPYGFRPGDPARQIAGDKEFLAQLKRSIAGLSQLRALDRPNPKLAVTFRVDMVTSALRLVPGMRGEVRVGPLVFGCFLMRARVRHGRP